MAFLPPFGMINPLPTVNHNDFQDWMRGYKSRKQPKARKLQGYSTIKVAFVPSKSVRSIMLRVLAARGGEFLRRYDSIRYDTANKRWMRTYAPGRVETKRTSEDLFNDIQRFLKEQARTVRPRGLAVVMPSTRRGGISQPWPGTMAYALAVLLKATPRRTERKNEDDRDRFWNWLDRKYNRRHPAKYMRRWE